MEELRNDISAGAQSHPGNFYPEGGKLSLWRDDLQGEGRVIAD